MIEWRGYRISERVNLESLEEALEGLANRHFKNNKETAAEQLYKLLEENGLTGEEE